MADFNLRAKHPRAKIVTLTCAQCDRTFERLAHKVNPVASVAYCSRKCTADGNRDPHPSPQRGPRLPIADRLWSRVTKTETCWLWTGPSRSRNGYGRMGIVGADSKVSYVSTHRLAFELTYGSIPNGMLVCHKCDNPPCVNPDHLFLGTIQDNGIDMARKMRGRNKYGPQKVRRVR